MKFLTRTQTMGIAALALGMSVFLSRILGLVRDKVISYYFGAGTEADVYFMAFVVPDFLNYLLAGGYFSISLVPLLALTFSENSTTGWRFFSTAASWAALAITVLTILTWLCVPFIVPVLAPTFTPEAQERLTLFLRIILPAQMFFLPGACFSAMLYYRRQFTVPALTPLVYNGCIILGGLIFLHVFPSRGMEGFCWGVLAGAALGSFALPVLAVKAGGMQFSPCLRHPLMKRLLIITLPLILGQSIVGLDEQFVRIFGSLTGEGGVSLLNYARRIMLVPVGVVAQAAGLASFPFLAALVASKELEKFDVGLNKAATSTMLLALPLSLYMMVSAESIMRLIFQQGQFSPEAATNSGILLAIMVSAVAFWAVQQILGRAFYAHQDTLTPALAGTGATLLALPVYWFGAKEYGAPGVAAAGVLGIVLYTLILCRIWTKRFGTGGLSGLGRKAISSVFFCLPACAAAYGASYCITFFAEEASLWGAAARIAVSGIAFGAVYLGLTFLLAPALCAPITDFFGKIFRRIGKKKALL